MSGVRRFAALAASALLAACARSLASPAHVDVPRPTSPALVVRTPAWSAADLRVLRERLATTAAPLADAGIAIVALDGTLLYGRHERRAYVPASTLKTLVAAASLETLGPTFRFPTSLVSLGTPRDGSVDDLYLVGSGDPSLTSDDLRGGAAALARAGITRISGRTIVDASAFAGREINPDWESDDLQYGYAAGTSALSLDEGTVAITLQPSSPGLPARVKVEPSGDAVSVHGRAITGYGTSLTIERDPLRNDFTIDGRINVGAEQTFYRPVVGLPRYAGAVLQSMLRLRGIETATDLDAGVAPLAGHRLWLHRSAPLRELIARMLVTSDNHYAEQLLRAIGSERGRATEASGALVERAMLARDAVDTSGLRVVDGSGLAPTNRVAPLTFAALLARVQREPIASDLLRGLPRAGIEGTVRYRRLAKALGRVRAKSGHIGGVNALVGYVSTDHHGRVAFAVLVNAVDPDSEAIENGIDRTLDALAAS